MFQVCLVAAECVCGWEGKEGEDTRKQPDYQSQPSHTMICTHQCTLMHLNFKEITTAATVISKILFASQRLVQLVEINNILNLEEIFILIDITMMI